MKILSSDRSELMEVTSIEVRNGAILVKGKVFGSMPMNAVLTPQEARKGLKLLTLRTFWFLITMPFRRQTTARPSGEQR
jgi:hypothetical protein